MAITIYNYFPNLVIDNQSIAIPKTSLHISSNNNAISYSQIYFALLYRVMGYYINELYIDTSGRVLLNGQSSMLSRRVVNIIDEFTGDIATPYLFNATTLKVFLEFRILSTSVITFFALNTKINQTLSYDQNNIFIAINSNYLSSITDSGKSLLIYLLNIGLYYRFSGFYEMFYQVTDIDTRKLYKFFTGFNLPIDKIPLLLKAEEV